MYNGQLFVLKNGTKIAKTNFMSFELVEDIFTIPVSNSSNDIPKTNYRVRICGLESPKCHLLGNKTDIVINYNSKVYKFFGCTVKEKLENGYLLDCASKEVI